MSDGKIAFATLVATPTPISWSQAYTAGKLYAVLSLDQTTEGKDLAAIGKEIISALVEEYFTLEEKNLDSIKTAVTQTTKKIPQDLVASFVVLSLVNNIVYAYSCGGGKILLKRAERVGSILSTPSNEENPMVHAVSGYVEDKDILLLETPSDAVETLSPKVHGKENGGASAIVLSYTYEGSVPSLAFAPDTVEEEKKAPSQNVAQEKPHEEEKEEEEVPQRSALEEEVAQKTAQPIYEDPPKRTKARFSFFKLFLFLLIPLILLGALAYTIYTTKQHQEESKTQQLFDQVYPSAQKQYDEGTALLSLNKPLALDDFGKAKKIIESNINKFPKNSSQRQKMEELLAKVEHQGGTEPTPATTLSATEVSESSSPLLQSLIKNPKALYATAGTPIYVGSNTSVQTASGKDVFVNDGDWKSIAGLGVYNANIYLLDKEGNQILKYLGGAKTSKSVYASGSFGNAVSMSIDSSIYVLGTDGSIKKFTSGTPDTFGITGLATPFHSPTRIYTTADTENIYVLDKGNSRIVALSKSGTFVKEYAATVIKNAVDFDVHEKEKKLYILASGKVYEIQLN
jgi:hypothetical protein